MHLIYIDDSFEKPLTTIAAIAVKAEDWRDVFEKIQSWRRELKKSDGILITREFHATEFVAGRGRLGDSIVTKYRRAQIFLSAFRLLNTLPIKIFTSARTANPDWATDRLLTRIHVTMESWGSFALLISDAGKEAEFTKVVRRLQIYNPINLNGSTINKATKRIIEDPFFKDSEQSYFIQMADFVAYGLLRREKHLESKNKYRLHTAFDLLSGVTVRAASRSDPMGVIR